MPDFKSIHALAYFNLLKTSGMIEEKVKKALKPFNLTHAQLNVLHILFEKKPEAVSASAIKDKILVANPDVTRLLDRLVGKELVSRITCSENRRKIDISITEKGEEIFVNAHKQVKLALGNFFEDEISVEEAKELRRILHKLRT